MWCVQKGVPASAPIKLLFDGLFQFFPLSDMHALVLKTGPPVDSRRCCFEVSRCLPMSSSSFSFEHLDLTHRKHDTRGFVQCHSLGTFHGISWSCLCGLVAKICAK